MHRREEEETHENLKTSNKHIQVNMTVQRKMDIHGDVHWKQGPELGQGIQKDESFGLRKSSFHAKRGKNL